MYIWGYMGLYRVIQGYVYIYIFLYAGFKVQGTKDDSILGLYWGPFVLGNYHFFCSLDVQKFSRCACYAASQEAAPSSTTARSCQPLIIRQF